MVDKKKRLYVLVVVLFLIFSLPGLCLEASSKKTDIYLNGGFWIGDEIGSWTAGVNIDFQGKDLMFSPEVMVFSSKLESGSLLVAPAAILNVKIKSIFAGAGIGLLYDIGLGKYSDLDPGPMAKINVGYRWRRFKVTVFGLAILNSDGDIIKIGGVTIGYRF